ncbi:MAG: hypothetical protein ACFFCM_15340 [Promethearchaeota archaeon]
MEKMKLKLLLFMQIFLLTGMVLINSSHILEFQFTNHDSSAIFNNSFPIIVWENNEICGATNHQYDVQLCSDGEGGAILTWTDTRNNFDIYAQRINSKRGVQWITNGVAICTDGNAQANPQICSDGEGGAVITWMDGRSGNEIYAQRINAAGIVQWTTNGVPVCNATDAQQSPQICSAGFEKWIITWEDYRNGFPNPDIYAQKINATGGSEWTPNGVAVCSAVNTQISPQICGAESGGAIITWVDRRNDVWGDVYAQKINATGGSEWTPNGVVVCSAVNWQQEMQICSDGSGGVVITWEDYRTGTADIYVQRINSTGSSQWTTNGTVICNASNDQDLPQICSDGSSGAIITWSDYRSGTNSDIYAQKIKSNGNINWTNNGAVICNSSGFQNLPQLCKKDGGALITWEDNKTGNYDIYLQIINSNGIIAFNTNGLSICTAKNDQGSPQIISDGSGGAIIAWEDERKGNYDIYANFVELFTENILNPGPYLLMGYSIGAQESGDIFGLLLSPIGLGMVSFGAAFLILVAVVIKNNKTIKELKKKINEMQTSKKSIEK